MDVDFLCLSRLLQENSNLIRIRFCAMMPNEKASIRAPIDWFDYNNYPTAAKTGRTVVDNAGKTRSTGDFAMKSGCRPLRVARNVEHVAIVSGIPDIGRSLSAFSKWGAGPTWFRPCRPRPIIDVDLAYPRTQFERGKAVASTAA